MQGIPGTAATWLEEAEKANVHNTSIHSLDDLNSGSKLNENRFLALRAIWKMRKSNEFYPKSWKLPVDDARNLLAETADWHNYVVQVTNLKSASYRVPTTIGTFASSWDLQQQVQCGSHTAPSTSKVLFSPKKTRSKANRKSQQQGPFTTPVPHSRFIDKAMGSMALERPCPEGLLELWDDYLSESDGNSPVTKEEAKILFPPLDNEPTVNACLIVFLNAICFHHRGLNMHWSLQQKAFNFGEDAAVFEARVDGYLRVKSDGSKRSRAIAEVKPYSRAGRLDVRFQETAQMAAWIFAEPDEPSESGQYARFMVSQDRHEIFIIIAEYNDAYIRYLTNDPLSGDSKLALMSMNEYGPWVVDNSRDMETFGEIILAFVLNNGVLEPEEAKAKVAKKEWVPPGRS